MEDIIEEIRVFLFGKEKNLAKTIVNWTCIFFVVAGFVEYGIDHNGNMSGLLKKETWQQKKSEPQLQTQPVTNDTVYIFALGNVRESKLIEASKVVSEKFNVITKICDGVGITDDMFYSNSDKIDPYYTVNKLLYNEKTIAITEIEMKDKDVITTIMGICQGNNMLISTVSPFKETLIHEFGHSFGLDHCSNPHCVMSTFENGYNINYGTNFCEKCQKQLNNGTNI